MRHKEEINRSYAIAARQVTVEQFLQFRKDHEFKQTYARSPDCPVYEVRWYDAAAYCNWLSEREGLPQDQWCYEPNEKGEFAEGMKTAANYLQRTGYRLPTEAEWEYACRARSKTRFSMGESDDLLGKYAWFDENSKFHTHPVGTLRPNDFGLFDMHGNAWTWCQDTYTNDKGENGPIPYGRVLRGGSFLGPVSGVRSAVRNCITQGFRDTGVGFRPARTFR